MNTFPQPGPRREPRASTAQRETLRWKMRRHQLDVHTVTLMHRRFLERAGLLCDVGMSVDSLLDQLTTTQASSLIRALAVSESA